MKSTDNSTEITRASISPWSKTRNRLTRLKYSCCFKSKNYLNQPLKERNSSLVRLIWTCEKWSLCKCLISIKWRFLRRCRSVRKLWKFMIFTSRGNLRASKPQFISYLKMRCWKSTHFERLRNMKRKRDSRGYRISWSKLMRIKNQFL